MFNIMRQMNTKIDQKSEYISEVFLFQFTNVSFYIYDHFDDRKYFEVVNIQREMFSTVIK